MAGNDARWQLETPGVQRAGGEGIIPPVLTTTQRLAIAAPFPGQLVFDSTLQALFVRAGGVWVQLGSGGTAYSEGTWNGSFIDTGGGATFTMTAGYTTGRWARAGNIVMLTGHFRCQSVAGAASGNLRVGTLPFATAGVGESYNAAVSIYGDSFGGGATTQLVGEVDNATGWLLVSHYSNGNISTLASHVIAGSDIRVGVCYLGA